MKKELFKFYSQGRMKFTEANLKGEKQYFIEGYASTVEKDLAGEVISDSAQESMLKQFRNRNITIDVEHEEWFDDDGNKLDKPKSSMIPVAKVVEAKKDNKGTWVKAKLNTSIERFKEIWGSIKGGFLNAFSIGFFPLRQVGSIIEDLNIVNLTLTGTPMNPGATFTPVLKSAIAYLKTNEMESAKTMESNEAAPVEVKVEAPVVETPVVEAPVVETPLKTEAEIKQEAKLAETVAKPTPVEPVVAKPEPAEPVVAKPEDIGAIVERILEEKLKEFETRLNPKKETKVVAKPAKVVEVAKPAEVKPISPLGMIKAIQTRNNQIGVEPKLKAMVDSSPETEVQITEVKNKTPLQLV